jgi:hypothetical protein
MRREWGDAHVAPAGSSCAAEQRVVLLASRARMRARAEHDGDLHSCAATPAASVEPEIARRETRQEEHGEEF